MEISEIIYEGNLRTKATHLHSGKEIISDAPLDNQGRGEAFSPTDLLATSLASCMITIMGITAGKHNFLFDSAVARIHKIMGINPRRVIKIKVELTISGQYSSEEKILLKDAALNCPVAKSIHPDIEQEIIFYFEND